MIKTKTSKRTKSIFLFFFLTFPILVAFPTLAVAQTTEELQFDWNIIDHNYLKVAIGDLERDEGTSNTGDGRFQVEPGGKFLVDFQELPTQDFEDISLVQAVATFEFSVNMLTYPGMTDVFPFANFGWRNTQYPLNWLWVMKFKSIDIWNHPDRWVGSPYQMYVNGLEWIYGNTNFLDIDLDGDGLGDGLENSAWFPNPHPNYPYTNGMRSGSFLAHDYFGDLPIRLSFDPPFSSGGFTINGYTFKGAEVVSEFQEVVVKNVEFGEVAAYQTQFAGNLELETRIDVFDDRPNSPNLAGSDSPSGDIVGRTLGFADSGGIYESTYADGQTGQSELYAYTTGVDLPLTEVESHVWEVRPKVRAKPQVTLLKQNFDFSRGWYWWDYEDLLFSPAGFQYVQGDTIHGNRLVGVRIDNQFIKATFQVKAIISATMEKDTTDPKWNPDYTGTNLDDPFYQRGDFIFDASVGGTKNFEAELYDPFQDFLEALFNPFFWLTGIIGIVIIVAVLFFMVRLVRGGGGGRGRGRGKTKVDVQVGGLVAGTGIPQTAPMSRRDRRRMLKEQRKLLEEKRKLVKEERKFQEEVRKAEALGIETRKRTAGEEKQTEEEFFGI